ncbi:hypothetical protein D3C72_857130 [compost metagenome]
MHDDLRIPGKRRLGTGYLKAGGLRQNPVAWWSRRATVMHPLPPRFRSASHGIRDTQYRRFDAVHQCRAGLAGHTRPGGALHHYPIGRARPQGGAGVGPGHPHGHAGARAGGGVGLVRPAGVFGAGVQHREICGRGVPDLAGPEENPDAPRSRRAGRATQGAPLWPHVPRRLHRQPAQPQDGPVLPGVPAAVRGRQPWARGLAGGVFGTGVCLAGPAQRCVLRHGGQRGGPLAAPQPCLPAL